MNTRMRRNNILLLMVAACCAACHSPDDLEPAAMVYGDETQLQVGIAVFPAGDVDDDGFDDLLVHTGGDEYFCFLVPGPLPESSDLSSAVARIGTAYSSARLDFAGGVPGVVGLGDVDGDGFDDLFNAYTESILFGPVLGDHLEPTALDAVLVDLRSMSGANLAQSAGDVNGDGFADFLLDMEYEADTLVTGPVSAGLHEMDDLNIRVLETAYFVDPAGDLNGDGYSDVVFTEGEGSLSIYFGSATGLVQSPGATIHPENADTYLNVSPAGDVDGDGQSDLLLVDGSAYGDARRAVYLFSGVEVCGDLELEDASATVEWDDPDLNSYAQLFAIGAGDVNADGFADVLLSAAWSDDPLAGTPYSTTGFVGSGGIFLFNGPLEGRYGLENASATFEVADLAEVFTSEPDIPIAAAGDLDADGFTDIAVGLPDSSRSTSNSTGAVVVFLGHADED